MRTYAQLTTSFVVFVNRVGVDESVTFWGGSEVIAPSGEALFSAPFFDEGLFLVDVNLEDVRRERIALPLLRDERLELQARELGRIIAERAGMASDSTADPGSEPGLDVAPMAPVPTGPRMKPRRPMIPPPLRAAATDGATPESEPIRLRSRRP
jgi:hypothetical protein